MIVEAAAAGNTEVIVVVSISVEVVVSVTTEVTVEAGGIAGDSDGVSGAWTSVVTAGPTESCQCQI